MSELVATVVLHPAGRALPSDEPITSDTIHQVVPAPGDLDQAIGWFRAAGFAVDDVPGPISFSISAAPDLYESWFGDREGPSFDVDALPSSIRRLLTAVEIAEPPDFGPGNP